MIRGTNKRIIEISGEDGSCFERIVLFLRPEQDEESEGRVLKMAEDYADGLFRSNAPASLLKERSKARTQRFSPRTVALALLALAAGAAVLCMVLL
ncbi:MAG: hypothetical protein HFG26_07810 [Provencibacterium sp.]|jgi:hypothetical protein|nr:hypothetical protein [Provencibacterium sp.]